MLATGSDVRSKHKWGQLNMDKRWNGKEFGRLMETVISEARHKERRPPLVRDVVFKIVLAWDPECGPADWDEDYTRITAGVRMDTDEEKAIQEGVLSPRLADVAESVLKDVFKATELIPRDS